MATLIWVGRDAVIDHHERVESRALEEVPGLSCGDTASGNLIIQGDNLLALKALLPDYAGQVKCLYVDPPYNTGTEGWVYNDRVDSPAMREWLRNVSERDLPEMDRRDRWLSMMYPRLRLAKELLSPDGFIAVSIDDREVSVLGVLLDEIFGARNRLACAPWLAEPSGGKEKTGLRAGHEYLLVYHNGDHSSISREARSTGKLNLRDQWGPYRKGRELTKWGDALVLDTFAGSGTTAQAVLSLNHEDGGQRRFILIEMEPAIASDITAERVRRVVHGYLNGEGQAVPGLGGGFCFLKVAG